MTVGTLPRVRAPFPFAVYRAAGIVSRLAGRGGGTTLPGKLLWKADPGAIDRLAARLPRGAVLVSATNGKTTTASMVAEILAPRVRVAHNASGANLVSGIASTLLAERDAELGLFEVDEGALPEVARRVRPRALCLGNLFRDQLDRYGELELIAERWRATVAGLPDALLVVDHEGQIVQVNNRTEETFGSLALASADPRRFYAGMGTMYLMRLAELASVATARFLPGS